MMGKSRSYAMLRTVDWGGGGGGWGGGGGLFVLLGLPVGALLALTLAAFLFEWALGCRLFSLSGYHNSLRGSPDVIF